jgi:D-tyrosyl-tRNA(Tyr) deacylase
MIPRARAVSQPGGGHERAYWKHMRALLQRVLRADITVDGVVTGAIGPGLLVFLGVGREDTERDVSYLVDKILHLRIFSDEKGKMNRNLRETSNAMLVASQFTLYGSTAKGRRPNFDQAAPPDLARRLYECFLEQARVAGVELHCGVFQAHMSVSLVNDGPVTILLDSVEANKEKLDKLKLKTDSSN